MTDKQIIIDGVDVRKCVNRRWDNSQKIHLCYDSDTPLTSWGWCENNPNCYYKQLKAKEQECEELRGVIRKDICSHYVLGECSQKHHNNCVGRNQCIKDLEQECERLKDKLNCCFCNPIMGLDDIENFKKCVETTECFRRQLDQLKSEKEELKEARKNSRCAWKSLEGTFCPEGQEQLDQLKADNKHLNGLLDQALKELEEHRDALEKIKELIQKEINDCEHCDDCASCEYNCCTKQILQMCDEVDDVY